jgi:hypothetical protein
MILKPPPPPTNEPVVDQAKPRVEHPPQRPQLAVGWHAPVHVAESLAEPQAVSENGAVAHVERFPLQVRQADLGSVVSSSNKWCACAVMGIWVV